MDEWSGIHPLCSTFESTGIQAPAVFPGPPKVMARLWDSRCTCRSSQGLQQKFLVGGLALGLLSCAWTSLRHSANLCLSSLFPPLAYWFPWRIVLFFFTFPALTQQQSLHCNSYLPLVAQETRDRMRRSCELWSSNIQTQYLDHPELLPSSRDLTRPSSSRQSFCSIPRLRCRPSP